MRTSLTAHGVSLSNIKYSLLVRSPVIIAAVLFAISTARGQAAVDDSDIQSWNEVVVTARISKSVDLYAAGTFWFGKNISRVQEARASLGLTFKLNPRLTFTPFVTAMKTRTFVGVLVPEYRINLRGVYKFPVKHFGLSHRSHYEYRFRTLGNTWRYAPLLTADRRLPKSFAPGMKVFVTEEPYYDSASHRFSRNRFSVGISKVVDKHLSFDVFYLRQDDTFSHPFDINVIGTNFRIGL